MAMKYETILDNGPIPVIGLGTWEVGGRMSPDYSQDAQVVRAFQAALELGYTHIDTAEMYGGGHTEELVGRAMRGFNREKLFLTSKVWHTHLSYEAVLSAAAGSLERLGTDYLDLYLIHWPSSGSPLEDTFRGLNELVRRGQVKHLGVSNFNLRLLQRAMQLSETPIITDQVPYSLYNREYARNGVLAYCQAQQILLTAYTPVEKGRVSRNPVLQEIAKQHNATPVQVALNWLVRQPKVIAIPMSTNPEHLRENLQAAGLQLSEEEVRRLDALEAG